MTETVKQNKAFGTWNSKISSEHVAGKTMRFGTNQSIDDKIYWVESRPNEAGRCVIMSSKPGEDHKEILPKPYSARSQVHEYGGAEFIVHNEGIFFVNAKDQDIYHLMSDNMIIRLTSEPNMRFSDMTYNGAGLLYAVAEYHDPKSSTHIPENYLVSISLSKGKQEITKIHNEHDFYAYPRISPDGNKIAWIAWDLPDMPWDGSYLYVADIDKQKKITNPQKIAGERTFRSSSLNGGKTINSFTSLMKQVGAISTNIDKIYHALF